MSGSDFGFETDQPLGDLPAGWTQKNVGRCRSCQAPIRWARNDQSGKMSPFDIDGTSHFATCPDAATFRKPRDAGGGAGSGAAAAVAVVEAARRHLILHREVHQVDGCRCSGGLDDAVQAFDEAMGMSR